MGTVSSEVGAEVVAAAQELYQAIVSGETTQFYVGLQEFDLNYISKDLEDLKAILEPTLTIEGSLEAAKANANGDFGKIFLVDDSQRLYIEEAFNAGVFGSAEAKECAKRILKGEELGDYKGMVATVLHQTLLYKVPPGSESASLNSRLTITAEKFKEAPAGFIQFLNGMYRL